MAATAPLPSARIGTGGEESRVFPCTRCGADLEFRIDSQKLACPYCKHEVDLEPADAAAAHEHAIGAVLMDEAARRSAARAPEPGIREVGCEACGARVQFRGTLQSTECAYCGAPIQLHDAHRADDRIPVDAVLPFAVDEARAAHSLRRWVSSRWFLPGDFKARGTQGRFNGVYLPFWTFDAMTFNRYEGQRGDHYTVTDTRDGEKVEERKTRWRRVSGTFKRFFDDVLVLAAKGEARDQIQRLEPWPLEHLVPFDPGLIAGHVSRSYDIELPEGLELARSRIDEAVRDEARRRIGGDEQRVERTHTHYGAITYKHLLLPLWLLAFRYRDRSYRVVVNAATGEVQGERPWSRVKLALTAAAALTVIGTVVWAARTWGG